MKIDLCKLFGVKEGEEFIVEFKDGHTNDCKYRVMNNIMEWSERETKYDGVYNHSCFSLNEVNKVKNIIKLPKKKQFSQDTLNFFKMIDKKYEWIARDEDGEVWLFKNKPKKIADGIWDATGDDFESATLVNLLLFKEILWEDEEPIYIDDYVDRK